MPANLRCARTSEEGAEGLDAVKVLLKSQVPKSGGFRMSYQSQRVYIRDAQTIHKAHPLAPRCP